MRDQEDPFLPDGGARPLHLHQPLYVGAPLPPTWRPLPSFSLFLLSSVQKGLVKQSGSPAGGNGIAGPGPTSTIFWPEGLAPPFLSCPEPPGGGKKAGGAERQPGSPWSSLLAHQADADGSGAPQPLPPPQLLALPLFLIPALPFSYSFRAVHWAPIPISPSPMMGLLGRVTWKPRGYGGRS